SSLLLAREGTVSRTAVGNPVPLFEVNRIKWSQSGPEPLVPQAGFPIVRRTTEKPSLRLPERIVWVTNVIAIACRMLRLLRPIRRVYSTFGQVCWADRQRLYLRSLARQIERVIPAQACDVVFSPGSQAVSLLNTNVPIVLCADAPF